MGFKNLLSRVSGVDTKDGKIIAELAFETGRRIAYQYLLGYRMAEQTYPNFSEMGKSQQYAITITHADPSYEEYDKTPGGGLGLSLSLTAAPLVKLAQSFSEDTNTQFGLRNVVVVSELMGSEPNSGSNLVLNLDDLSSEHRQFIMHYISSGIKAVIP